MSIFISFQFILALGSLKCILVYFQFCQVFTYFFIKKTTKCLFFSFFFNLVLVLIQFRQRLLLSHANTFLQFHNKSCIIHYLKPNNNEVMSFSFYFSICSVSVCRVMLVTFLDLFSICLLICRFIFDVSALAKVKKLNIIIQHVSKTKMWHTLI